MEILDKKGKLLAKFIRHKKHSVDKNFFTENKEELQVASFNLKKDETIIRHYHPKQDRVIKTTSEVIIIKTGVLQIDIYDDSHEFIDNFILEDGDIAILISGGHGLKVINDCEFIEVKQGPYNESTDKTRF